MAMYKLACQTGHSGGRRCNWDDGLTVWGHLTRLWADLPGPWAAFSEDAPRPTSGKAGCLRISTIQRFKIAALHATTHKEISFS